MRALDELFEDNLTDIAQYNPHLRLYLKDNKDFVEDQLGDIRMMLYEWEGDMVNHRAVDIIELALVEQEDWVVYRIMNYLGFNNELFNTIVLNRAYVNGRDGVVSFMIDNGCDEREINYAAAEVGDISILVRSKKMKTPIDWLKVACIAAKNCNSDIVYYALKNTNKILIDFEDIAYCAARGGCVNIVEDMIEKGELGNIAFSKIAERAAKNGHVNLMESMIERSTSHNWTSILCSVAEFGDRTLLLDLIERGQIKSYSFNLIAMAAAGFGHNQIVEDMLLGIEIGGNIVRATNLDMIAEGAASGGFIEIVERMIELGASNWHTIARGAASNGHKAIVLAMLGQNTGVNPKTLNFREHEDARLYFS